MELSPQQDVYYIDIVSPIDYFIDTVTPSAIQLNKEKTMSIELDGPLYLGSNSLQQQVDQNTEDITELQSDVSSIEGDIGSLDNLATSDKSSLVNAINETLSVLDPTQTADYIKNSKGLESGEISDNASIYPWVEEMSHSTFDASKFIKVGSPIVTSDGIASGFSSSNYLTKDITSLDLSNANSWEIQEEFNYTTSLTTVTMFSMGDGGTTNRVYEFTSLGGGLLNILFDTTTDGLFESNASGYTYTLINNTNYTAKCGYNSTGYYLKLFDGNSWTTIFENIRPNDKLKYNALQLRIGGRIRNDNHYFSGSIDLKQFSITVDGVEVFSGNKTGIDTIKPDDYTVVGTPTITPDGVASGFSSSNYIKLPEINIGNSFDLYCTIPLPSSITTTSNIIIGGNANNYGGIQLGISNTDGDIFISLRSTSAGGSDFDIIKNFIFARLTLGQTYDFHLNWNGTKYVMNYKLSSGSNWTSVDIVTSSAKIIYSGSNNQLCLGSASSYWSGNRPLQSSIDLNSVKIYVDGNLVYQPCLKIPYTESKTGSKIVNSIYRDRVNDMAEQFGFAPYYTLDTTNSNYTIPKGEVYGMINKLVPTLVAPDYSKPVSLTYSSGLVMENDGWLEVQIQSSEATANPYVSINGSIICRTSVNSNGDLNRDTAMMVVRKGDVITSGGYSADTDIVLTYYPFKV